MNTVPVASLSRRQYAYQFHGAQQPYLAEVSPYQYGAMSGAARRRYDKQREADRSLWQWACSEYAATVRQSAAAGICEDAMHEDARDILRADRAQSFHAAAKAADHAAEQATYRARYVQSPGDVTVGQRLSYMRQQPCTVVKVSAKSIKVQGDDGAVATIGPNMIAAGALLYA